MSIDIVRGTSRKPASSEELIRLLSNDAHHADFSGQLFIGYPIVGTSEGPHPIDALLLSQDKGIVIFDLVEGTDAGDYRQRQDDSANKLEARLKTHRELMERRNLRIPIHTISFLPGVSQGRYHSEDEYSIADSSTVVEKLKTFNWREDHDETIYEATRSAIESVSTIRHTRARRRIRREDSRGAKLKRLEESIATLDNTQSKAVIETVEGVQRIRGLAGSGKTIVLALKAAYLHAQHPEWRIAVTFNTRSLKGQFRRLINNFSLEQTNQEPDWENLRIVNAWGAPGGPERDGIYHEFCRVHDLEYLDFRSAEGRFGPGMPFSKVCEHAVNQVRENKHIYDVILIDEAQDFSPAFLRLCYKLLRDPKRLVYAYDELQNLTGESLPSPDRIFVGNGDRSPAIRFDDTNSDGPTWDIILEKCYRNSRPVLVTAHALGFGIYREPPDQGETGLIQMFDNSQLWTEVGYQLVDSRLEDGEPVVLQRASGTSPLFLERHSAIEDLIQFIRFDSEEAQTEWLAEAIRRNLEADELRHNDIVVINPNPLTTRGNVGPARHRLFEMGINTHVAGVDTDPDTFFETDKESVTFTGVFRAKGNEAGMIYIINAQDCHSSARNLARIRNWLFTAITRSKAWVRVLGIGSGMEELKTEFERLKNQNFELKFTYPNAEQRERLRIVHRDMTAQEQELLQGRQQNLHDLVLDLKSGNVRLEDLDENVVAELKELLG